MKNTINVKTLRRLAIIAFVAVLGLSMAACKPAAPAGTYYLEEYPTWTITFGQGSFSMFMPAEVAPSGSNTTMTGVFIQSNKTLTLSGLDVPMMFTITNSTSLKDSDGDVWKKSK